ncbi:hypothetical protein J1N35_022372 [Gossypium stocksii]|uniref:Uncharacterized protein n=1 Tax=Gossypium stocksii TaxID=47602 RepID=A0A9D4A133_9ROSI|nr:hypothetical protein J1N35_022372 [Gossypium stocksii]
MQEISEVLPLWKEDMSDIHNSDHENPFTIDDHDEIYGEIQSELVMEDHVDKLNIVEMPKPILNESLEEPIHFLAIVEKMPIDKVEEFDSFSFDNDSKAQVTKALCNRDRRKLEAIIP